MFGTLFVMFGKSVVMEVRKILHIDGDALLRDTLKAMLKGDGANEQGSGLQIAQSVSSGKEAIALFEKEDFDLVLMDIDLPDENGYEVAKKILQVSPEQRVVILSMHCSLNNVHKSLEVGLDGHVSKKNSLKKLVDTLNAALAGMPVFEGKVLAQIANENKKKGRGRLLTEMERQLLRLLYLDKSRYEIARYMKLSERTIDIYIVAIKRKLDVKSKRALAVYAERYKLF